jgi:hypothetical protein
MFVTTKDLDLHLLEEHNCLQWVCNYCADDPDKLQLDRIFTYDTADAWVSHVKTDHHPEIPLSQLRVLSSLSEKKFIKPTDCPLCDVIVSTPQAGLDAHIADHLHSFALRALPWGLSQGHDGSDTSRLSAGPESNTTQASLAHGLPAISDIEWLPHVTPVIVNWGDLTDVQGDTNTGRTLIEDWRKGLPGFSASDANENSSGGSDLSRKTLLSGASHNPTVHTPRLRLLAIDGGGVRGLSALMILEQLMESINPETPPKPCDCFDMIGGTSTGGYVNNISIFGRSC